MARRLPIAVLRKALRQDLSFTESLNVPSFDDRYVNANGIRTRYWSVGDGGVPLVLLHGLSGTIEDWSETLEPLSVDRRVIAVDLLGSGKTDKPKTSTYAADIMRDHILSVLDALSLDIVDINGWSLGGRIALDVAFEAPGRLRRLVLTAPAGIGPDTLIDFDASFPALLGQAVSRPFASGTRILGNAIHSGTSKRLLRFAARRLSLLADTSSRDAFVGQMKSIVGGGGFLAEPRDALLKKLPLIQTPTLAIWGRNDHFSPFYHSETLLDLMPDCRLQVIEQCGHAPQIEWPVIYNAAVADFLD